MQQFFSSRGAEKSLFAGFAEALADLLHTQPENIHIFSVADAGPPAEKLLNVWFAARRSPPYRAEALHGYVAAGRSKVRETKRADFSVFTVNTDTNK